ncbi:hypothetical protein RQP46_008600 [Phenoliferia psychrophenolica]
MSPINPPTRAASFTKTVHAAPYPAISPTEGLAGSAKGLNVLITGSGRGIGAAAALTFAQAGARQVVITARSASELDEVESKIQSDPHCGDVKVVKVVADILNEQDVERLFEAAGDVDVLLNNAGTLENPALIAESKVDEYFKTWEVNIKGTYLPTRQLLRGIEATPRSSPVTIINTSSVGSVNTRPGLSSYQSSKSAINRFTEFLHYEYSESVRAFAYHPGGVMTKLAGNMPKGMHHMLSDAPELAGCYALFLATQPKADFLRGRYSSCKWDVDELVARTSEVLEKNLLFTVVAGQEPTR